MGPTNKLLNRVPTKVILWVWPIARVLMCWNVYHLFSMVSPDVVFVRMLQLHFFAWFGWTVSTTLFAIVGQTFQPKLLRLILTGDSILILAAILLLRGADGATIAFAISVSIIAICMGVTSRAVSYGYALAILAFLSRDIAWEAYTATAAPLPPTTEISNILEISQLLLMTFVLLIWANRRSRLDNFDKAFSSHRTLSFEKSFEFDLQIWTDACAALFFPGKAACVICAPARSVAYQYYHHNLPIWQREQDRDEIVAGLRELPLSCIIFDIEHNEVVSPQTGSTRPFDDNEQRVARVLHRADVKAALIQPMMIDHARGAIICALGSPLDPMTIAEASFIDRHVTEMSAYLGKISAAQRNFIADAHDVARRDLHDGVLQTLAALRMRLLILTKRDDVAYNPVELEIRKAVDIVTLEQSRLRGFLESSEAEDHTVNLVSQIDICVRTISLQWGIDVKLKSDEMAIPVDKESSFNIEHLLREVITNAVRHSKSKSLTVTLSLKQDALMMAVTDLSQQLEGAQMYEKSALTLKSASLRDRLRLVNGEAYAEGLGKGTLLSIRIPMQQIEND